ncbi:TetR/AcrR family transcriptional regulator [Levilactobacillus bambusae]|uniref:TetR/AcrR family transcriptional regulator n=1 Tax=Levilactobacillus bambusae TaxID=2024736 RepID=UPI001401F119|nr:TetR/AcrR family transcriptional regulator [Levilactobacillus bambusae]
MRTETIAEVTVSELTARSGISRNYFYRHFSSKVDVIAQYFDYGFSRLIRQLEHRQQPEKSTVFLQQYFAHLANKRDHYRILMANNFYVAHLANAGLTAVGLQ